MIVRDLLILDMPVVIDGVEYNTKDLPADILGCPINSLIVDKDSDGIYKMFINISKEE